MSYLTLSQAFSELIAMSDPTLDRLRALAGEVTALSPNVPLGAPTYRNQEA
jgi:hypothetical protein